MPRRTDAPRPSASPTARQRRAAADPDEWRERFEALLRAAVDAVIVADEAGMIEAFSPAAVHMFGHAADEVLGTPVTSLMPEPYRSQYDALRETYLREGQAEQLAQRREAEALRRDGSSFPIELSLGEAHLGSRRQFVVFVRDLSARHAAEATLREREQRIQAAFENAPLATLSIAPDGRVLRANRAAAEALGCKTADLSGESVLDLVVPENREGLAGMLRSVIAGESQGLGGPEWLYLRQGGGLVVGRSHASVVRNGSGEAEMVVLQFEDRTERRRISQELARVRDDLAHVGRLGTVGELATGIAHEINQPLTAISTYAKACRFLLERRETSTERIAETLEKISESARRAGAVIEQLRGFLRKRESDRTTLRAEDLVRAVAQLVSVDPRFIEIELELELDAQTAPVAVDRVQLQQVLLNLLLNALDAMEAVEGGQVTVAVTQPSASEVMVSVRDQGAGIPEELGERVFESFFSTKPAGMGFGLALSRSIAEAHGGRLWFTGNEGGGTTFHLVLPTAVMGNAGSTDATDTPSHEEATP